MAVYKGVKSSWRADLQEFFNETKFHNVDKPHFPKVLKNLVKRGCLSLANAVSGFEAAGIFPLNKEKVLGKIQTTAVSNEVSEDKETTSTPPAATRSKSTQTAITPPPLTPRKALEQSLLSVLRTLHTSQESVKCKRLTCTFAESLTSPEAKKRLESLEKQNKRQISGGKEIKKKKLKRKLMQEDSRSSDDADDPFL